MNQKVNLVTRRDEIQNRVKQLSQMAVLLRKEISDFESMDPKLNEKEKLTIKKLEETAAIYGYHLEKNNGTTLLYKKRELENITNIIMHSKRDLKDINKKIKGDK